MGKALSLTATAAEFEAAYNNRARVPDHPDILERWYAHSQKIVEATPPQTLDYGPSPRQKLDWFDAGAGAPVAIFLHGGYWQALDRSWFSFVAPPLVAQGISVVIPSYDLCPDVTLGQIINQIRQVVELVRQKTGKRPFVFGHSAGGHMAAGMLSEGRVRGALALSGVFDLEPLVHTSLNEALRLDAVLARALSPIHWPAPNGSCPGGTSLDCWVGGDESNEFVRQSRSMAAEWGGRGAITRVEIVDGANHFTIVDQLADPASALVKRVVNMATHD